MNSVGFEFGYDLEYQIFNWVLIICILDINFGILRNMVLDTFWEFCLETYDYNDDDLGAHSMWFRLGRVTPLDGAAPMERPPLGGEGYHWEVKHPNWKCFTLVESREKSYPLDGAAPMEMPPLGGEGYQRDGANSRFTHFDYFH